MRRGAVLGDALAHDLGEALLVAQLDQAAARGETRRADTATAQARATRSLRLDWGQCEVPRAGFGRFGAQPSLSDSRK